MNIMKMINSNHPKINILYDFQNGPWGGGNQFLKALQDRFINDGIYSEKPKKADVILFNSHHKFEKIIKLKYEYPEKILIHRIDGPIEKYRGSQTGLDKIIYSLNNLLADGTIFQSNWSKQENYKQGMAENNYKTVIINAPNSTIFNKKNRINFNKDRKIKLIATSWSNNLKKGFDIYQYLDNNLDFDKYEMIFIGNSPIQFKNIKWIKPLNSEDVAQQLKQYDIFITASQKDPCSNSLIEALHCGLPAIALNEGGHPEIIKKAGEIFNNKSNIIKKIDNVVKNYKFYQNNINLPTIDDINKKYYNFIENIYKAVQEKKYYPKKITIKDYLKIKIMFYKRKLF